MSFDNKNKNNKDKPDEISFLNEKVQSISKEDLYKLISYLILMSSEIRLLILEWLKTNTQNCSKTDSEDASIFINDNLLMDYWEHAREIISEFNEYGGGPEEREDKASDWLDQISDLIEKGRISPDAKFEFLDEAFKEYNIGNSGFDDTLMDLFFQICQTKEEWEYLVKKLEENPSEWKNDLIMTIYKKHLHNEKAYLDLRLKDLNMGMDYWDLTRFYMEKKDLHNALETAEQGILKGKGRLTELFEFLLDYFAKKKDLPNLERIAKILLDKDPEDKPILEKIFKQHRIQGLNMTQKVSHSRTRKKIRNNA